MPELDSKIAIERRQKAIEYITEQGLPSRPIKRFLTKHFKHYAEDGTEYIPTLFVKDEFDTKGNRKKKGSKSSLTLKHFEDKVFNL